MRRYAKLHGSAGPYDAASSSNAAEDAADSYNNGSYNSSNGNSTSPSGSPTAAAGATGQQQPRAALMTFSVRYTCTHSCKMISVYSTLQQ
jgi:hypothetical protein